MAIENLSRNDSDGRTVKSTEATRTAAGPTGRPSESRRQLPHSWRRSIGPSGSATQQRREQDCLASSLRQDWTGWKLVILAQYLSIELAQHVLLHKLLQNSSTLNLPVYVT